MTIKKDEYKTITWAAKNPMIEIHKWTRHGTEFQEGQKRQLVIFKVWQTENTTYSTCGIKNCATAKPKEKLRSLDIWQ